MWVFNFSLDNLSLMALTIGTGFIVDDAIVMIENIVRNLEGGKKPLQAALDGAREIGFTVVSLTCSLIAVFIPLLFMTGLVGRMFREFALTLTLAVIVSAVISLTLTPMMCAGLLRRSSFDRPGLLMRLFDAPLLWMGRIYASSLTSVLRHQTLMIWHCAHSAPHGLALYHHSQRLSAAARHRTFDSCLGGLARCVLHRYGAPAR